jgi:hypothetical protein
MQHGDKNLYHTTLTHCTGLLFVIVWKQSLLAMGFILVRLFKDYMNEIKFL